MKKLMIRGSLPLAALLAAALLLPGGAQAVRLKDVASVSGVRANQLLGYGLVVGLDGTGDGNDPSFTAQSLANLLKKLGINRLPQVGDECICGPFGFKVLEVPERGQMVVQLTLQTVPEYAA